MSLVIQLKIKKLLLERNMTQNKLSELSGVPPATLSDIVNDKRSSVNKYHLARIAEALGVDDINELIEINKLKKEKGDF